MDRREFILDFSAAGLALAGIPGALRVVWRPRFVDNPFTLGVASGDPTHDSVVLWTRLAPDPLNGGGMGNERIRVRWEVATDDAMHNIVKKGDAVAFPEFAHSVHVELKGLKPDRWYWYRFQVGDATSAVGRTRTVPEHDKMPERVRFGVASCQHFEEGLYTAHSHMARENFDLVAFLGDYIYENGGVDGRVRKHHGTEILSLADYRTRYAQYKSDRALQAAHAMCPWLIIWDDHEVDNNYAGSTPELNAPKVDLLGRRAAGYQAWYEHMPVRLSPPKQWQDFRIYRDEGYGALLRFWMLDGRQYRTDQPCGDGRKLVCAEAADPTHTMLGATQEQWLANGLSKSPARWEVLGNQVMLAPYDTKVGPEALVSMDQWSGYPAARDRLLDTLARRTKGNAIVITGDIHSSWVNDIPERFLSARAKLVATEFVGTSITSGGDGSDRFMTPELQGENPHIKWQNSRRGYMRCEVTPSTWQTDYRLVDMVTKPDAPIVTKASFVVNHGSPGAHRTDG